MTKEQLPSTSLETALARYHDFCYVITIRSTSEAFLLAMKVGKLSQGDAVLCSPNAPLSFFYALKNCSLLPTYNDLMLNGCMESRFLERNMTAKTKALVLSHNHGLHSPSDIVSTMAQRHHLFFIEDATEVLQTQRKSGASLVIHTLSSISSNQCDEGAYIATDNRELAAQLIQLRKGGYIAKKLWNYDLINTQENLQLSSIITKMAHDACSALAHTQQRQNEIATMYLQSLSTHKLLELPNASDLSAYHHFPIWLIPALFCPKEDIYQALIDAGIDIKVGNKAIYKTTAYKDETLSLFGAEEVFKAQLLLPCHHLMTDEDVTYVVVTLEKVLETYGYRGCSF